MELTGFRQPSPEDPERNGDGDQSRPSWPSGGRAPAGPVPGPQGQAPALGAGPAPGAAGQAPGYWWPETTGPIAPDAYYRAGQGVAGQGGVAKRTGQGAPGAPRGNSAGGAQPSVLRRIWQRIAAAIAAVGAFLAKFGALLLKLKYLSLVLSMFVSVLAYTLLWGWSFAVGFVLLMFVHEMGHVVELRRQGIRASLPMFIPFLGAFVNMREMPRSAYQEALSGLAGPYFGTAASAVVGFWGHAIGSNFLLQLAAVGFLLNLFNLLPMLPLDGGRAVAALHPAIWFIGLVGLLVFAIFFQAPVVLLVLVLGGFELWRRWTRRNSPASVAYHSLSAQQRLTVGGLYILVIVVALAGFQIAYVSRSL